MDQFINTKYLLHLINGPIHKHQGFIKRSKWTHHKIQSEGFEKNIEWTNCANSGQS